MQFGIETTGQVVSQNRLAVVLALIILAIVIVGWIVQLGGSYRAGSRNGSYGEVRFAVPAGAALISAQELSVEDGWIKKRRPKPDGALLAIRSRCF